MDTISARRFHEAGGVEDWRALGEGVRAFFRPGSFADGARLVAAIGELDGLDEHHPDVDLRWEGVTVRLFTSTDDHLGLTKHDLELARRISAAADRDRDRRWRDGSGHDGGGHGPGLLSRWPSLPTRSGCRR